MKVMVSLFVTLMMVSLQSTVVPVIATGNTRPDLVLVYVVSAALVGGRENGVFCGLLAGLLQDLLSVGLFGINAFSKMIVGLTVGLLERKFNKNNPVLPMIGAWGGSAAAQVLAFLFLAFHGMGWNWALWGPSFFGVLLYHSVLILPVYWLLRLINHFVDKQ